MFLKGCRQGVGDVAGEDGADDGDSEGAADFAGSTVESGSHAGAGWWERGHDARGEGGNAEPHAGRDTHGPFLPYPAALAQDPPVPAAKAFYVNLPGPLTCDGARASSRVQLCGVDVDRPARPVPGDRDSVRGIGPRGACRLRRPRAGQTCASWPHAGAAATCAGSRTRPLVLTWASTRLVRIH